MCPSCGTRSAEWDPVAGGDRNAYVAVEQRCRGCEQIQAKQDSLTGDAGRGVYVTLKPTREVTHAKT